MNNKDSIMKEIFVWSKDRPLWQREALRRLIEKDLLEDIDFKELGDICKAVHNVEMEKEIQGIIDDIEPLSENHIPEQISGVSNVSLMSISNTEGVNALAKNQILNFGDNSKGLVVIYGDNASGKSGYCRIIKRACRARNRGIPIKSNIFEKQEGVQQARALITMKVDGQDRLINWIDGEPAKGELSYISFFDSECAFSHVGETNDIAFTPFGLDLLENLAFYAKKINSLLSKEKSDLENQRASVIRNPNLHEDTSVSNIIKELSSESDFEIIKRTIELNNEEKIKLTQLRIDLNQDPHKLIEQLKFKQSKLKNCLELISKAKQLLSDEKVEEYKVFCQEVKVKNNAAKFVAEELFADEPLPNVGSEIWSVLWNVAKDYSEKEVYKNNNFPFVKDEARCVLCHQLLNQEAVDRFKKFDDFVKDNVLQSAKLANKNLIEAVDTINKTRIYPKDFLKEIKFEEEGFFTDLRRYCLATEIRRRKIQRAFRENVWPNLPQLLEFPNKTMEEYNINIESRISDLEKSIKSEERKKLENERYELEDREWAMTIFEEIKREIIRLEKINKIDKAIRDTITTSITNKSKQLASKFITNTLRDRFIEELSKLSIKNVRVELSSIGGESGKPVYQIKLIAAPNEDLKDILSEGEYRCIAIAGFLTELATDQSNSSVVFDDPVCSLDHKWREKVAERLVQEAEHRQVIVFTHDIVFLHDLGDYAEKKDIDTNIQKVFRSGSGVGTIGNTLPWKVQKILQRIDSLEKELGIARAKFDIDDEDEYEELAKNIYSKLRATVERAIEGELFSGVVVRHRDYINTKNLARVKVITSDDIDILLEIHDRCCDITESHDPSIGRNAGIPNPDDIRDDINKLSVWIRDLKQRRNS